MFKIDYLSRRHVVTKNVVKTLLLAFFVALPLSLVGVSSAFASTQPRAAKSPNIVIDQCLEESGFIIESGNNAASGTGETYNNCLATVTFSQTIAVRSSCPGIGTGSGGITTPVGGGKIAVGISFIQNFDVNAGCVVCEYINHILQKITYPDFTLSMSVTAGGTFLYHNILFRATSNTASDSVLIHNSGKYAPTCPPTD